MGFWPLGSRSIFIWGFLKDDIFGLCWNLRFSYRVMISWRILVCFRGFFKRLYFCIVKYLNFRNSSFAIRYFFNVNGKATVWHTLSYFVLLAYQDPQNCGFHTWPCRLVRMRSVINDMLKMCLKQCLFFFFLNGQFCVVAKVAKII